MPGRGLYAGVAYVVPTGVGSCRQFHTFLQNDPAATAGGGAPPVTSSSSSKSFKSMLTDLQTFWHGNRPTWMQHMLSHVLIDADIAIQARVDYNR